jgi:hypothetical protein
MFHNSWFGEDNQVDEIDPGKDIFALLFLSFFLINAVVLLCVSEQSHENVSVNTSGKGQGKKIEQSCLATIKHNNNKLCIIQNQTTYYLPDDLPDLLSKAKFETRLDNNGKSVKLITISDPGTSISAGSMLSVIQILNNANIGVDFRPVATSQER